MKKPILAIFIIIAFASCSKTNDINNNNDNTGIAIETSVQFHILDKKGNDLLNLGLNNAKEGLYDYRKFKMYYLVHGKKHLVKDYDPGADTILLFKDPKPYCIRIFTDSRIEDGEILSDSNGYVRGVSIAYLELNEFDTDTIKTEWSSYRTNKSGAYSYFINVKVWYNGVLKPKYNKDDPYNVTFDVIK